MNSDIQTASNYIQIFKNEYIISTYCDIIEIDCYLTLVYLRKKYRDLRLS